MMLDAPGRRVCMAVISDMTYDARVYKEARSLVAAGYSVRVISTTPGADEKRYVQDGIEIHALPLDVAGRRGINGFFRILVNELRDASADIYHAHNVHTLPFCWWAARRRGAKVVYDSHELFTGLQLAEPSVREWIKQFIERVTEWLFVRSAAGVITVNRSYAEILARTYRIPLPVILQNTPQLVPLVRGNRIRQAFGLAPERWLVLYQGGYHLNTRALDKLVLAARELPPEAALVFIGFALRKEDEILKGIVQQEQLGERVFFLDPVPHQELLSYTMEADIGVIPFIDNCPAMHFSTPNKIYEYLMAGVGVVCTDLPELRRIVEEDQVGAVCDPTDVHDMARVIRQLAEDRERLAQIRARARAAAEQRHNWEQEEEKLISLYRTLEASG